MSDVLATRTDPLYCGTAHTVPGLCWRRFDDPIKGHIHVFVGSWIVWPAVGLSTQGIETIVTQVFVHSLVRLDTHVSVADEQCYPVNRVCQLPSEGGGVGGVAKTFVAFEHREDGVLGLDLGIMLLVLTISTLWQ